MQDMTLYGIDWNGPISTDEEEDRIEVSTTENPLEERDYIQLQSTLSSLSASDNVGVDLYIKTLNQKIGS